MFVSRHLALARACTVLADCDQISAGLTPTSGRTNAAFPLADTLQIARNALTTSFEDNKGAQQPYKGQDFAVH